ncbi:MAG: hypothetical protein GY708_26710 [Actinomycetia bacterium]|nr:hypothetical protein [Actinomycetes bacterium]MCP4961375.1 hypothetical protein [Actinomycetes bacterium]
MSEVVLSKSELESGRLPLVCIASGEPVESLTEIALGSTKIPQLGGLPSGLLSKAVQAKLFGFAIGARIGRSGGVKNKQILVLAARAIFSLGLLYNTYAALSAGNLVMVLVSLVGLVGVIVLGGAYINRALTVGLNTTEGRTTVSGAHPAFVEALGAIRSSTESDAPIVVRQSGPPRKPVPAAGLY